LAAATTATAGGSAAKMRMTFSLIILRFLLFQK
jgi:hypothetical protein